MRNLILAVLIGIVLIGLVMLVTQCGQVAEEPTTTTTTTTTSSTTTTGGPTTTTSTSTTTTTTLFSISGKIGFATTSDGIKGGVELYLTASPTVIATTTANATDGTYSFTGLEPGTYTVVASKAGWTISDESSTISSANVTRNLAAYPTSWEVLRVGGGESLKDICSSESVSAFAGTLFAVGGSSSVMLTAEASDPTNWMSTSSPTTDALVEIYDGPGGNNLIIYSYAAGLYTNNGGGWVFVATATSESVVAMDQATSRTAEAVTATGKLLRTEDQLVTLIDISPAGAFVRDVRILDNDEDKCVAVGNSGVVGDRYDSGSGSTWHNRTSDITEDLTGIEVWGSSGSEKTMVVSSGGNIYVTEDTKFEHFTVDLGGVPYSLNGVRGTDMKHAVFPSGAVVVGDNGLILRRR